MMHEGPSVNQLHQIIQHLHGNGVGILRLTIVLT